MSYESYILPGSPQHLLETIMSERDITMTKLSTESGISTRTLRRIQQGCSTSARMHMQLVKYYLYGGSETLSK